MAAFLQQLLGVSQPGAAQMGPQGSSPASRGGMSPGMSQYLTSLGFGNQVSGSNGGGGGAPTSILQQGAGAKGGAMQMLSTNPEMQAFKMMQGGLMDMFNQNSAEGVGAAAMPLFQQGLQFAQGSLANSGQGRFSTAFENQGIGLAQRALQDFNLLQNQAFMQNQQNRLGAAGQLGSLAGAAGGAARNPILQLLLGGMQFAQPQAKETIAGKSPLDVAGQAAAFIPFL